MGGHAFYGDGMQVTIVTSLINTIYVQNFSPVSWLQPVQQA